MHLKNIHNILIMPENIGATNDFVPFKLYCQHLLQNESAINVKLHVYIGTLLSCLF